MFKYKIAPRTKLASALLRRNFREISCSANAQKFTNSINKAQFVHFSPNKTPSKRCSKVLLNTKAQLRTPRCERHKIWFATANARCGRYSMDASLSINNNFYLPSLSVCSLLLWALPTVHIRCVRMWKKWCVRMMCRVKIEEIRLHNIFMHFYNVNLVKASNVNLFIQLCSDANGLWAQGHGGGLRRLVCSCWIKFTGSFRGRGCARHL